jgi:hypothetical protein
VAYGACGCSGGIFHDLYCVWGGADKFIPIDVYIPGCPPTPAATIYGFAMALGMLGQKMKATHHIQGEDEHTLPRHQQVPLALRVDVERESRRMAGYVYGKQISDTFLNFLDASPEEVDGSIQAYLDKQNDPRLTEIVTRLQGIYHAYLGEI